MDVIKAIAVTIIGLAIFVAFTGHGSNTSASAPTAPAKPALRDNGWRCYTEATFERLEGQVTNISEKPLSNVEAVGVFKTSNDQFVKSAEAMVTYNPIMPGQTSPYLIITSGNPLIANCAVSFKAMFGSELALDK